MNSKIMLSLATVALLAATASADTTTYEGVETNAWFKTENETNWSGATGGSATWSAAVLTVDTAIDNQYVYTPTTVPTADGYRISANVTFVRSATTMSGSAPVLSEKAPLAALAATGESWFGVVGDSWVALSGLTPPANDETPYAVVFDFKTNGVSKVVRYTVNGTVLTNSTGVSEFTCARQSDTVAKVAVAGYGTFANIEGMTTSYIVFDVANEALTAAGITTEGKTAAEIAADLNTKGSNKMYKWQSVMLGLDTTKESAQPYAAPVQNADARKLEFALGGVNIPEDVDKSKIEYAIEVSSTPTGSGETTVFQPSTTRSIEVDVPNDGVKYYRIKVRINR